MASGELLVIEDNHVTFSRRKINARTRRQPFREVFMVKRPYSPIHPPKAPDVRSSNESESNISPEAHAYESKIEEQRRAREREQTKSRTAVMSQTAQRSPS